MEKIFRKSTVQLSDACLNFHAGLVVAEKTSCGRHNQTQPPWQGGSSLPGFSR